MSSPSNLILDVLGLGDGSGLGIRESLRPLENGQRRRTINGELRHTGVSAFRQYELTISSEDVQPPALGDLWPGDTLTVVPVSEIGLVIPPIAVDIVLPRLPHPGSVRTRSKGGLQRPFSVDGRVVRLFSPAEEPTRVYFRPVLTMMLTEPWSQDEAESGGPRGTSWSIELAEVSS